jgi:adenylylsulfate kinase
LRRRQVSGTKFLGWTATLVEALPKTGFVVWLTGLPGAGKTTIALRLAEALRSRQRTVEVLDGDEMRQRLSPDLGYTKADRDLHVRRVGFVAELLARNGIVVVAALVSPYRQTRDELRHRLGRFVEVYVSCPLEALVARDPKGLYREALRGGRSQVTGIDDPYEPPLEAEVVLDTASETPDESAGRVMSFLEEVGYAPRP